MGLINHFLGINEMEQYILRTLIFTN